MNDLLDSIKGFKGFDKDKPQVQVKRVSEPAPADDAPPSILDQLKKELMSRAQFLNDSSEEEDESDSEWQ